MRYNVVWNTFAAGIAREDFLYALHTLLCRFAQTYFGQSKTIRISIIANQSLSRSSLFFADLYRPTSVSRKLFVSQSAPTSLESHFTLFFADLQRPTLFSRKLSIPQSTPTSLWVAAHSSLPICIDLLYSVENYPYLNQRQPVLSRILHSTLPICIDLLRSVENYSYLSPHQPVLMFSS